MSNVQSADLTSLTVFYFDRDRDAQKREGIAPTENDEYGPLRVRYASGVDTTTIQIGGPNTALRHIVAFGPDCRSAKTNPLDSAAGENDAPTVDFTWDPALPTAGEDVMFTSMATDPDGELIHYGWDFDSDGTEEATGAEVTHTFETAGDRDVTHTVIDDFDNHDTITKTVTIEEAERWWQIAKLSADDGDSRDRFGYSVAVDGDTAVIGTRSDEDPNGSEFGSVYVFIRTDGSWSQQQKLIPDDGDIGDRFGWPVAVDGDTAIVGASADEDPNGPFAGSAYVFTREGENWSQQQKLTPDDGDSYDHFGNSVAVDKDTAVVGAYVDEDPNGNESGSAYVFTRAGGSWSQQQKLTPDDGDPHDQFGDTVAVNGDTAVVGAYSDDLNGDRSGSAYVFTQASGNWNQQQKLTPDDGDSSDHFGNSVAVDRDTIVVGARNDDDPNGEYAGSAYIFRR